MGRVGFMAGYEAIKAITAIAQLPRIVIEGMFTHFATADEPDDSYVWQQFEQFMGISRELDRIGLSIPIKHVCNSAATMRFPAMHLDMVRPGLILTAWCRLAARMPTRSPAGHDAKIQPGSGQTRSA
jgi:alanine racemase